LSVDFGDVQIPLSSTSGKSWLHAVALIMPKRHSGSLEPPAPKRLCEQQPWSSMAVAAIEAAASVADCCSLQTTLKRLSAKLKKRAESLNEEEQKSALSYVGDGAIKCNYCDNVFTQGNDKWGSRCEQCRRECCCECLVECSDCKKTYCTGKSCMAIQECLHCEQFICEKCRRECSRCTEEPFCSECMVSASEYTDLYLCPGCV
jgi:hypothetical protein